MINEKLINYLHSVYPELTIDISFIKGYSNNEIAKIERLYDIKITGQLHDFLCSIGRCSGGLFGDDPLLFYRDQWSVRGHILFQTGFREELNNLNFYDLVEQKPFFISIEWETQYYFLLTKSDNPNLVYHYDENEETVKCTQWEFDEYLRYVVDEHVRKYKNKAPFNRSGELINI